jgi:hypothetical protein
MKQELIKKMQEIANKLQHGDKTKALLDIGISEPTLNKYLKGDIVKLDMAEKIITYFESK